MRARSVVIAPSVRQRLIEITSRDDALRVRRRLEALALAPKMGMVYDPVYEAARPPHEVRVTYAGHYGIYYTYDEGAGVLAVEYLEDCRRDPMRRFSEE